MNFMFWLQSTKNNLDLVDFHMNKQRTCIDLNIFKVKRIERWFSNFLSTLLHSIHTKLIESELVLIFYSFLVMYWFKIWFLSKRQPTSGETRTIVSNS
ncbi:hypothetical protein HanIR_Chr13g0658051 [Helianthus annuus]|nr:hypothetical protein HanIR_Chr13g0658051 [Helianthus annuus]